MWYIYIYVVNHTHIYIYIHIRSGGDDDSTDDSRSRGMLSILVFTAGSWQASGRALAAFVHGLLAALYAILACLPLTA